MKNTGLFWKDKIKTPRQHWPRTALSRFITCDINTLWFRKGHYYFSHRKIKCVSQFVIKGCGELMYVTLRQNSVPRSQCQDLLTFYQMLELKQLDKGQRGVTFDLW